MEQLVTCSGMNCSLCTLLETTSALFSWLIGTASAVSILFLVIGGFLYLNSFGNEEKITKAKKTLKSSLIGLVISLVSFLVIGVVFQILGANNEKNWWNWECEIDESNAPIENSISKLPPQKIFSESTDSIEDSSPIIKEMAGLNEIVSEGKKIGIFDLSKVNADNLKQDILNIFSGDSFRLLAVDKNLSDEDIADYTLMENGYADSLNSTEKKALVEKVEKIADFRKDDGDVTIIKDDVDSTLWWSDPQINSKIKGIIDSLEEKDDVKIVAYKDSRTQGTLDRCIDSEGDFREFNNECEAKKSTCGNENLNCSNIKNTTMGCACPEGTCSLNGKCVKKNIFEEAKNFETIIGNNEQNETIEEKDDDGDGILNELDNCSNTPGGETVNSDRSTYYYGCSCSQIDLIFRACAENRCEGENWVDYPSSGRDTCSNGVVSKHSCSPFLSSNYDDRCVASKNFNNNQNQIPDEKVKPPSDSPSNGSGSTGNTGNTGNTGGSNNKGSGGDSSDKGNSGDSGNNGSKGDSSNTPLPPDKGPGNFNPSPSFKELAECIGFKDGKVPYNGVIVLLLNKDDPTNAQHPNSNASRLFYLSREGQVIGNAGDPNGGGLKAGPWTKGSGGTAWSPGWNVIPNAQDVHVNGSPDPYSFKAGAGHRVGPQGESLDSSGRITSVPPNSKDKNGNPIGIPDMSGCNMHSGNNRNHSKGCMTMGSNERKGFTQKVKSMATKSGGKVLMARLIADNTDPNSQKINSDYCGKMDPEKAIQRFKEKSQYKNWNPNEGY